MRITSTRRRCRDQLQALPGSRPGSRPGTRAAACTGSAPAPASARADRQFELDAVPLGQFEPPDAVDHREPVGEVGQEVGAELRDRFVRDAERPPVAQSPGHTPGSSRPTGEAQHRPGLTSATMSPCSPRGRREGAVDLLVVVG